MGKRHREIRKSIKRAFLRDIPEGWRENEFGELVFKGYSKTKARLRLIGKFAFLKFAENDIVKIIQTRAIEEIKAIEDSLVFSQIESIEDSLTFSV